MPKRAIADSQVLPGIYVNPGSGALSGATRHCAVRNIRKFVEDLGVPGVQVYRKPSLDGGGRWGFTVASPDFCAQVEMPGWPLRMTRYMRKPGQDPWDFPRLYVDGSSWLWSIALDVVRDGD